MDTEGGLKELKPFMDDEGRLTAFPAKNKKQLMAIWYLAGKIEAGRQYSEQEINNILDKWAFFHDHATLRREMYNKRLLNRTADCSLYQKENEIPPLAEFVAKNI